MTNCTIEIASWEDIEKAHNAVPEFVENIKIDFAKRCERHTNLALIARFEDKNAGYMVSYDRYQDGSLYIWMAGVNPEFRKKGVNSSLFYKTQSWAAENGYKSLKIKTRNDKRNMLHWLIKNGFMFTAVDKREPITDSRLELIKDLSFLKS